MELSWSMKLRIAAAAVIGVVLIGIVSWPSDATIDPFGSVLLQDIGTNGAVTLLIMAFLAGLVSYFAAWPYGREIGILAVPFGLCVWTVRAGSMGGLMQLNPMPVERLSDCVYGQFEQVIWEL